jgi:HAD superfamily hydrolase (TIGR01549 family)
MTSPGASIESLSDVSRPVEAVSFDLFGTLVTADRPADPATAVAEALRARDVVLPDDWQDAYRTVHVEVEQGAELALSDHVLAILDATAETDSAGVDEALVREALLEAFDSPIRTREGAVDVVERVGERVPVGILSNCSVPGLVERTIRGSSLAETTFDAVLSSVDVGWRKPSPRAFEALGEALSVEPSTILHVGDDPRTDGGATRVDAQVLIVGPNSPVDLATLSGEVEWLR